MTREFDDLVDARGPDARRAGRLERVHEHARGGGPAARAAGRAAGAAGAGRSRRRGRRARRSRGAAGVARRWRSIAAALALGCLRRRLPGRRPGRRRTADVVRVAAMSGLERSRARASVRLGREQPGGNWPIELTVTGLPQQADRGYYELFVLRDGKPGYPCGGFRMLDGTTTVRFTVPYELKDDDEAAS